MRPASRINLSRIPSRAVLWAALALLALPSGVNAQDPGSASFADTGLVALADMTPAAAADPDAQAISAALTEDAPGNSGLAADTPDAVADTVAARGMLLDDQMLSVQRGGFSGMLMVAATPQQMQGNANHVTLWDEIAPPAPLPIPTDVARSAQGNITAYQRN